MLVRPSVGPHITSKTDYAAIASRRGEGRGNQLMLKTGNVEIASRLVTVARSCLLQTYLITIKRANDQICPECRVDNDSVSHVFQCPTHPTRLTKIDLWKRPVEVANFLSNLAAFSHLPRIPHSLPPISPGPPP
jgi:hypothetical protein